MRKDAGGRLVTLLRSEVFAPIRSSSIGHELKHEVMEGSAVVAGRASDTSSCEIVSVQVNVPLWHPGAVVDLRSNDEC